MLTITRQSSSWILSLATGFLVILNMFRAVREGHFCAVVKSSTFDASLYSFASLLQQASWRIVCRFSLRWRFSSVRGVVRYPPSPCFIGPRLTHFLKSSFTTISRCCYRVMSQYVIITSLLSPHGALTGTLICDERHAEMRCCNLSATTRKVQQQIGRAHLRNR